MQEPYTDQQDLTLRVDQSAPSIGVIICCYTADRLTLLLDSIESIRSQLAEGDDLLVVVDHNAELKSTLESLVPNVRVVENQSVKGLSGARNTGVLNLDTDIVAFIDDDARAEPSWVDGTRRAFLSSKSVIGSGGASRPRWEGPEGGIIPLEFYWVFGCTYRGLPKSAAAVRNAIGSNMAFRRQMILEAGLFDTALGRIGTLPVGCEETELSIRLAEQHPNGSIIYDPSYGVDHFVPASRLTLRYFLRRCFGEGVSKAAVTKLRGRQSGLSAERDYVAKALPTGMLRDFAVGITSLSPKRVARGLLIPLGLATTAFGYSYGMSRRIRRRESTTRTAIDIAVVDEGSTPTWRYHSESPDGAARELWQIRIAPDESVRKSIWYDGTIVSQTADESHRQHSGPGEHPAIGRVEDFQPLITTMMRTTLARTEMILRTAKTILEGTYTNIEFLIVDNAPDDRDRTLFEHSIFSDPRVRIVRERVPGTSPAFSCGLREARGEFITMADDDILAPPMWLERIAKAFGGSNHPDIVTGQVIPLYLTEPGQLAFQKRFNGMEKGYRSKPFSLSSHSEDFALSLGELGTGASMSFRRSLFKDVDRVRNEISEDLELLWQTYLHGGSVMYEPSIYILHEHRTSMTDFERQLKGYGNGLGQFVATCLPMSGSVGPRFFLWMAKRWLRRFLPSSHGQIMVATSPTLAALDLGDEYRAIYLRAFFRGLAQRLGTIYRP